MAPTSVDVTISAPPKSRVIISDKCSKCNRTVRNGVLCDSCDRWIHFKCGKIEEQEIPDENTEWLCPTCIIMNGTMAEQQSDQEDMNEVNLKGIIDILQNDLKELQMKYEQLKEATIRSKDSSNTLDLDSSVKPRPTPTSDRWETVLNKKPFRPNMECLVNFPALPLKNRFETLSACSEKDKTEICNETRNQHNLNVQKRQHNPNKTYRRQSQRPKLCEERRNTGENASKIRLFTDSQGRLVANELSVRSQSNVLCMLKPGAKFDAVTEETKTICADMTRNDTAVIIGGTNDVACNETTNLIRSLKRRLQDLRHTNVLVFNIPRRHDLPSWSCVNREVVRVNEIIGKVCSHFDNVKVVDLSSLGARFHTKHGLHLNKQGKMYIADRIVDFVNSVRDAGDSVQKPIPLAYDQVDFLGLP